MFDNPFKNELASILRRVDTRANDEEVKNFMLEVTLTSKFLIQHFTANMITDIDKMKPSQFDNFHDACVLFLANMLVIGNAYNFDEKTKNHFIALALENMFDLPLDQALFLGEIANDVFAFSNNFKEEVIEIIMENN